MGVADDFTDPWILSGISILVVTIIIFMIFYFYVSNKLMRDYELARGKNLKDEPDNLKKSDDDSNSLTSQEN